MFWKKDKDTNVNKWMENTLSVQAKLTAVEVVWTEMMTKAPNYLISPVQNNQASMLDIWIFTRMGSFSIWFDNNYEFEVSQTADVTKQLELITPLLKRSRTDQFSWDKKTKELNSIITSQYKELLNWGFEAGEKVSSDNNLFKEINNIDSINFLLEGLFQKLGDELIKWQVFHLQLKHSDSLFECPKTIFEIIFEDVTMITKRISLAAKFGTEPISVIERLVDEVKNDNKEQAENLLDVISKIVNIDDPDLYKKA